jgi:hypothetical protein
LPLLLVPLPVLPVPLPFLPLLPLPIAASPVRVLSRSTAEVEPKYCRSSAEVVQRPYGMGQCGEVVECWGVVEGRCGEELEWVVRGSEASG